jgi:sugar lactone lactonase YvrE
MRAAICFGAFSLLLALGSAHAAGTITTLVGNGTAGAGGDGGLADAAQITQPDGLAFDGGGNLYVVDQSTNSVRKVNRSGVISTIAGVGAPGYSGDGGAAVQAKFNAPRGIAVDSSGNLYVADSGNNVVRMIARSGIISTIAGTGASGYTGDGSGATQATLSAPRGLAFDSAGNLYIADSGNNAIRKVAVSNNVISTFAGSSTGAPFNSPRWLAFDGVGNLYVADTGNNAVRRISPSGAVSLLAGSSSGVAGYGGDNGPATAATLRGPRGLAFDGMGNLYVGDQGNNVVRMITPAGVITTVAGSGGAGYSGDGVSATAASLLSPGCLVVDSEGNLLIADSGNFRVRSVSGVQVVTVPAIGNINTFAGNGTAGYGGDGGPALLATLNQPDGLTFDAAGNLYVADQQNNTIRKITAPTSYLGPFYGLILGAYISDVAGTGTAGYSGDGGPATLAMLNGPRGLTFDANGNLWFADTANNVVREINLQPGLQYGVIATVVGQGPGGYGYSGDGGLEGYAKLNGPRDLSFDPRGNLFIADTANNAIRKIDTSGSISTFVGPASANPNIPFILNLPRAIAFDGGAANLYIADTGGNAVRVVNMQTSTLATLAGTGTANFSGDGGPAAGATLNGPRGVVVDPVFGNVYISDYSNRRVRMVDRGTNLITTVAGTGAASYSGDNGPATSAALNGPTWATFDSFGNMFISDLNNARIREVYDTAPTAGRTIAMGSTTGVGSNVTVYPVDATTGTQPVAITFNTVTTAGLTSLSTGTSVPALPASTGTCTPSLTMTLSTTATVGGGATVCVTPDTLDMNCGASPTLWEYVSGAWRPLQPSSSATGQVCGIAPTTGQFAVLTPSLGAQTITFPAIMGQVLAASPLVGSATASSGLTVTFKTLTPLVCTTAGDFITLLTVGTCTIAADQIGDSVTYAAAPEVTQTFTVSQAAQTITFPAIGPQSLSASPVTVSATASSGLLVTVSSRNASICTVAGLTVTLLSSGTCTLAADQAGNSTYGAAPEVLQSFTIQGIGQTITMARIANVELSMGGFIVPSARATSGLPISLSSQTTGVCTVSGSTVTPIAVGTCTLTANQSGSSTYTAAVPISQSFEVVNLTPTNGAPGTIVTTAGNGTAGSGGNGGLATQASLSEPDGIAFDRAGNYYVADQVNNSVRKVTPSGVITLFAGSGVPTYTGDGGQASAANLNGPRGLAFDAGGNLYIADTSNNVIRMVTPSGVISTVVGASPGSPGYGGDGGPATAATLNAPRGLAFDAQGNLYIADTGNNVIRMMSAYSGTIITFAGAVPGTAGYSGDGAPSSDAMFRNPRGIAFDGAGNLYVADTGNNAIREISAAGLVSTFAGQNPLTGNPAVAAYSGDGGPALLAAFSGPIGIAFDGAGNLYVGDENNNAVRMISPTGTVRTVAGNGTAGYGGDGGAATAANLDQPVWIAIDESGNLYVSGLGESRVREVLAVGPATVPVAGHIKTVAGNGTAAYTGNGGPGTSASLSQPAGLAVDAAGDVLLADQHNNVVRRLTAANLYPSIIPADYIVGVAGTGMAGYLPDNVAATAASLDQPFGIAVDRTGNLYIADTSNNVVREVNAATGVISTLAQGLNQPHGLAFDASGNLYVADTGNNLVRMISVTGTLTTIAGNMTAGSGGDGGLATSANLSAPFALAFDGAGNLYIADSANNRIRVVNASSQNNPGMITTLPGTSTGSTGALNNPRGVALDLFGNAYVADYGSNRVLKIAGGAISTVAGTGTASFSGDGGPAVLATLKGPSGVAFDSSGNLFVSDRNNNLVREIFQAGVPQGAANTSPGTPGANVVVSPVDTTTGLTVASISFAAVGSTGLTTVTTGISAPATPTLMATCSPPLTLDVSTTATFAGPATVCVIPNELGSTCASGAALWHYTSGAWQQLPAPGTTPLGQVCGMTNSFSPFAILGAGMTPQTISFGVISNQSLSVGSLTLAASASSGLTVLFSSLSSGVCTVSGALVTLLAAGICQVAANQPGNPTYAAATQVTQSFAVSGSSLQSQTISFQTIGSQTLGAAPFMAVVNASSGLAVTLTTPSSSCSVSGLTITLLSSGICSITATQPGNASYAAASPVTQMFSINAGTQPQTISFPTIASQALAAGSFVPMVSATSGLTVTLTSQTPATCGAGGTTVTLFALGTCTLQAMQAGNGTYAAATPVVQSFSITGGGGSGGSSGGGNSTDGPLPLWALWAMASGLIAIGSSKLRKAPKS